MGKERGGRRESGGGMGSARGGTARAAGSSEVAPQPSVLLAMVWLRESKEGECGICREIERNMDKKLESR